MPNIDIIDVHKRYGNIIALDGVTLNIKDGEYICIIGPSGSGKSTLLKIVAGILKPDKGDVFFDGIRVTDLPISERRVGIVMQDILLFPHMDVWENVTYSPLVKGMELNLVESIGREIVGYLGLTLDRRMYPSELSRGAQQKVAIARALAANPKLLLLDEPLGSLDTHTAKSLRYELRKMVKDLKLTAIHITHNQEEALSIADRVVVLRRGKVEQVGTPLELYTSPKSPFICRFIGGEANFLEGTVREVNGIDALIKLKGGTLIRANIPPDINSQQVVVAIRPEDITISLPASNENTESFNILWGLVEEVHFLGPYMRYIIETEEGPIIVRTKRGMLDVKGGDNVVLHLKTMYVYPYPKEGLERAIAYE